MVQCEMCGSETGSPRTVTVEGAELQVCEDCAEFGTEVETQDAGGGSSKYSTSSGSSGSGGGGRSGGSRSGGSGGSGRRRDMFDDMDEVVTDYDDRIRSARESADLTQAELADRMNEKTSLVRKLERGEVLPSDDVQRKLESQLGISLTGDAGGDESDWESDADEGGLTLGDMVKRKD